MKLNFTANIVNNLKMIKCTQTHSTSTVQPKDDLLTVLMKEH